MPVSLEQLARRVETLVGQDGEAWESIPRVGASEEDTIRLSRGGLVVAGLSKFAQHTSSDKAEAVYDRSIAAIEHLFPADPPNRYLSKESGAFLLRFMPDEGENIHVGRVVPVSEYASNAHTRITTYYLPNSRLMTPDDMDIASRLLDAYEEARSIRIGAGSRHA